MPPRRQPFSRPVSESVRGSVPRSGRGRLAALALVLGLSLLALSTPVSAKPLEEKSGSLPTSPELERLRAEAKEAERGLHKGEAHFALEMKKSHVYVKVLKHGEVIGRFKPETEATSVRAEISTYNIGRAL